jgi:hypothetical protein
VLFVEIVAVYSENYTMWGKMQKDGGKCSYPFTSEG